MRIPFQLIPKNQLRNLPQGHIGLFALSQGKRFKDRQCPIFIVPKCCVSQDFNKTDGFAMLCALVGLS